MAAADRWTTRHVCPSCGNVVSIHWIDRAYLDYQPEITGIDGRGYAREVNELPLATWSRHRDHTDVLCLCGVELHQSELSRDISTRRFFFPHQRKTS